MQILLLSCRSRETIFKRLLIKCIKYKEQFIILSIIIIIIYFVTSLAKIEESKGKIYSSDASPFNYIKKNYLFFKLFIKI